MFNSYKSNEEECQIDSTKTKNQFYPQWISVTLSTSFYFLHLCVCVCLSIYLSIYLSTCVCVYLPVPPCLIHSLPSSFSLSACLSPCPPVCLSVRLSVCLFPHATKVFRKIGWTRDFVLLNNNNQVPVMTAVKAFIWNGLASTISAPLSRKWSKPESILSWQP